VLDADGAHLHKDTIVYTDRWFTSPTLMIQLAIRGFKGVGTIMTNRKGTPADFKEAKPTAKKPIESGTFTTHACYSDIDDNTPINLYATGWMDKKWVYFLSSAFGLDTTTCVRKLRDGTKVNRFIPLMAKKYQTYMGGVDLGDQLKTQYSVAGAIITMKPWFKLFVGMMDLVLANAYILYKMDNPDERFRLSHWDFLLHVFSGLIELAGKNDHSDATARSKRRTCKQIHDRAVDGARKGCVTCKHHKRVPLGQTRTVCRGCGVHLCEHGECFDKYHKGNW
jgi:hypothetical protein